MNMVIYFVMLVLFPVSLMAETYTWVDDRGTVNFTEDFSHIPLKYRNRVHAKGDTDFETTAPLGKANTGEAIRPHLLQGLGEPGVNTDTSGELFDGKTTDVWQQEFRMRTAEVKRFDLQFERFEELLKKPIGIQKDRAETLSQEFQELREKSDEAVKRYNELNAAANKAGLPVEFRR